MTRWNLSIQDETDRKVRVFLARTGFKKGDLSYSKARSMSRTATPTNEEQLLDFAIHATAAQVDRHCMELRNVQRTRVETQ